MNKRILAVVAGLGAAALAVAVFGNTQLREAIRTRRYLSRQLQRQYPGLPRAAPLDFRPFESALGAFATEPRAELAGRLLRGTIADIQQALASGRLTAYDLVLAALVRIRATQHLNAVIELNPDILTLARLSDAERRAGRLRGPLHGIPVLLKDNIATGDHMHNTAGALALQQAGSDRDSFVAHRLRSAGALLLGKANMSEWACYMTSDAVNGFSALGGQTHHPLGEFEVGGSSSGSAAAVAAGLVPVAIGTETSGSLVYPASQHGIVTLKPSLGLVSRDHIIPITDALDTAGPLTHTVADAALMMSILVGYDSNDPLTEQARVVAGTDWVGALQCDGLRGMRVAVVRVTPRSADSDILDGAIGVLKRAGAEVVEAPNPRRVEYSELMESGFKNALNRYLASVGGYAPVRSLAEIIGFNRDDPERRAPYGQNLLEQANASTTSVEQHAWRARELRTEAADMLQRFMDNQRVDLIASLSNYLTTFYAPAGFPAVCVRCGTRASDEPVGLTLIGPYLGDARLLAAAFAFECARDAQS